MVSTARQQRLPGDSAPVPRLNRFGLELGEGGVRGRSARKATRCRTTRTMAAIVPRRAGSCRPGPDGDVRLVLRRLRGAGGRLAGTPDVPMRDRGRGRGGSDDADQLLPLSSSAGALRDRLDTASGDRDSARRRGREGQRAHADRPRRCRPARAGGPCQEISQGLLEEHGKEYEVRGARAGRTTSPTPCSTITRTSSTRR